MDSIRLITIYKAEYHSLLKLARRYLNLLYRNSRPTLIEIEEMLSFLSIAREIKDNTKIYSM